MVRRDRNRVEGSSLRLNERAAAIADAMVTDAAVLGVVGSTLENRARLIDCGIEAPGGLEAGRLLAEICLGGAGRGSFTSGRFDGLPLPRLHVWADHPAISRPGLQYARVGIQPRGYFPLGA